MSQSFQLVAGHVALDFANTLDYRFDRKRTVDLLSSYECFIEFALQSGLITGPAAARLIKQNGESAGRVALRTAIDLRENLDIMFRSVITGRVPSRSSLDVLNRFLAKSSDHRCLIWKNSEFILSYGNLSDRPDGPIWPLLAAAMELLTSPSRVRIRECKEPSCRWLFLDNSKNHSRVWCDMQLCGNRTKVRKFRQRNS